MASLFAYGVWQPRLLIVMKFLVTGLVLTNLFEYGNPVNLFGLATLFTCLVPHPLRGMSMTVSSSPFPLTLQAEFLPGTTHTHNWKKNENKKQDVEQGTYTLGRFLAHASILCTVMGADQNKESFPYPGVGSTVYVMVPPRNQRTHFASMR